jgi:hypothetical protein
MGQDKPDLLGPLMNEIGQELVKITDGNPDGIFLYVEAGSGWIEPSIFKDDGQIINYLESDETRLDDLLFDAWKAEPEDKRWSVMEYEISGGKFAVTFKYPEEVDVESIVEDRREEILRARYGDRPVVYPPMPEGAFEVKS